MSTASITLMLSGCVAMRSDVQRVEAQMMKYNARLLAVEGTASNLENTLDEQTTGAKEAIFARLNEAQSVSRDLMSRVDQIEQQLRTLLGDRNLMRSELGLDANETTDTVDVGEGTIAERLAVVEAALNALSSNVAAASSTGAGVSDKELYAEAQALFKNKQYEEAEAGFGLLLRRYPNSKLASNAHFWIGESFYKRQDYLKALSAYKKVLDGDSKAIKAPDAYLKTVMALRALGENDLATTFANELVKLHPKTEQATAVRKLR